MTLAGGVCLIAQAPGMPEIEEKDGSPYKMIFSATILTDFLQEITNKPGLTQTVN